MTGGRRSFVASVEPVTDFVVWTVCLLRSGGWNSASRRSASPFFVGVFYRPGAVLWPSSSVACVPRRLVSRARASPVLSLRGHRPRLPLLASPVARVRWCACPCPPTQYTLPPDTLSHRRTGAAGTALHMDSLGSARPTSLLPLRRVARRRYTHSLARTLAHSGTAPSGQASTHHTFVEGRRGATPAQLVYCSTYCRGSARASQAHIVSLSAPSLPLSPPFPPVVLCRWGGGGPRRHLVCVWSSLGLRTLPLRCRSVRRLSSLGGCTLVPSLHYALRASSRPGWRVRCLLSLFLSSSVSSVGPLARRSPATCARSMLGLVSCRRRCGSVMLLMCVFSSCHAGCPSRVLSSSPSCPPSRPRVLLPYRAVVPRRPRRCRGAPVPSVASAAPGEVPPGRVPWVSRAVVVCLGGRADRQLVEAGHGVPVEEGLDVSVRLEL